MKYFSKILFVFLVFFIHMPNFIFSAEEIKMKILVVNPSDEKKLQATISQALPNEIDPDKDIIDDAGLDITYQAENKTAYLTKTVEIQPKETKTYEVRVRDVWQVSPEEIEEVKNNLQKQIDALKDTKYFTTANLLYTKAIENLDRIVEEQNRPLGISQHIEAYRAHMQQIQEIRHNVISLEAIRKLEEEKDAGVREARFVIEAENPSSETRTMSVRSILPQDVKAEDVLDKQDFSLFYNQPNQAYILEKTEQFEAKEKKRYIITIKDIWYIPDEEILFQKNQMEKLLEVFKDTSFFPYAKEQGSIISEMLDEITKLQEDVSSSLSLEERMRAFVLNTQKMELVKTKLRDLQQLLYELPLKKKDDKDLLATITAFIKKIANVKDIILVAMGFQPNRPITWWIILGIIVFLGIVSAVFYVVWLKKLQENKWAKTKSKKQETAETTPPQQSETTSGESPQQ